MNKNFVKVSNPVTPTDELLQLLHSSSGSKTDKNLRGAAVVADSDLILDICIMYTNEALADFSGRLSTMNTQTHLRLF